MFTHPMSIQDEAKLEAMQRQWQHGRLGSSVSLFEEVAVTEDLLTLTLPRSHPIINNQIGHFVLPPPVSTCEQDAESEIWEHLEPVLNPKEEETPSIPGIKKDSLVLDASTLGDLPARYEICSLESHQMPTVGVYVDQRIVPGFKYRVRPLPQVGKPSMINKCLFEDKALTLKSIGRGYARRFTFDAYQNCLNNNDNYFWSDNRPEGYSFELELISEGDKFTFFNMNGESQGTVEILTIEGPQIEIACTKNKNGIEKKATVNFIGKVEYYETGVAKPMSLSGVAVSVKAINKSKAEIVNIVKVNIKKRRCYLLPGMQKVHRRVTVRGQQIKDVPTKYTMTGLESYEIPVVGTYVDPRVIPGFYYKVRPNDRKDQLFGGRALKLMSIGMGYAKRLTFQPDSLVEPDNYLWSDNHPDGLGLEPRAVHKGMRFMIKAGDLILGEAHVFRDDLPQFEEKMEKISTPNGIAIEKHIHVDVICHLRISRTGGGTTEDDELLMRVSGVAVVRKEPKSLETKVIRVGNIGLDSQLSLIFAQTKTDLIFVPK